MSDFDIDPALLDELDQERNYAKSGGSNTSRLKLEKDTGACCRFLPVQLGANKSWFARVGLHWIGKRPVNCIRTTSPALGGDPKAHCPVCEVVEKLAQSRTKEIQTIANKANSWPQWLTYLLVFETSDTNNRWSKTPPHEVWTPNEFWMPKTSWLDLSSLYKRQLERSHVNIIDPADGYDIMITKSNNGTIKFELDKRGPLADFSTVEELQAFVTKLCSFKQIDTSPATPERLEEAAMKLEDLAYGTRRSSHGRERDSSDMDAHDEELERHGRGDRNQDRESPRRESREESRREETREPPRAERAEQPPPRREAAPAPEAPRQPPPPPPSREASAPPPTRREPPPPPPARRPLPPESTDQDPEAVPPERRDPAPASQPPAGTPSDMDEIPPPFPTGTPVAPVARVSDKMAESMRRISSSRSGRTPPPA